MTAVWTIKDMGTSVSTGGCDGTAEAGVDAIGEGDTSVGLIPQNGQKLAPCGGSLPQFEQ
jgi:hypothetical protein